MGLRKSIYSLMDLPHYQWDQVILNRVFHHPITEKTDGFVFEIGWDEDGFFVRSGSSKKMRKFGDFAKDGAERFAATKDFNPMIAARLDLALHILLNAEIGRMLKKLPPIVGEMILKIDGKSFCPNGTRYVMPEPILGRFIIHTRRIENRLLDHKDIELLKREIDQCPFFEFDDDIHPEKRRISLDLAEWRQRYAPTIERERESLNDYILKELPQESKWYDGCPEGFIIHLPSFSFKVMTPKKVPALTQLY